MEPEAAKKQFLRPDDLIVWENKTWLPIEATEIAGGFLKAWETGARQWREHSPGGKAGFYPVREAWSLYEPVGLPGEAEKINLPDETQLLAGYQSEVRRFVDRELYPQVAELEKEIRRTQESPKAVNALGVLYARYGLNDRAEHQFLRILKKQEYPPALTNLGNIYYLASDLLRALEFYQKASRLQPNNPLVLLGLARTNHELENYGSARSAFSNLKKTAPELADRFSYLELQGKEAARAAEAGKAKGVVVWGEE